MDDAKQDLHHYLRIARDALLWKLDGVSEYDVRRPMTPTGTNLLGLVKHVASVGVGYFGEVMGRPFPEPMPWFAEDAEPNADLFATADESRSDIVAFHHRAWAHADATIEELDLHATGFVPWWPEDVNHPTLHRLLVHMVTEINRHLGHADILRELTDGSVGHRAAVDNMADVPAEWWDGYRGMLERVAREAGDRREEA